MTSSPSFQSVRLFGQWLKHMYRLKLQRAKFEPGEFETVCNHQFDPLPQTRACTAFCLFYCVGLVFRENLKERHHFWGVPPFGILHSTNLTPSS